MKAIYNPLVGEPVRVEIITRYQNKIINDGTWYVEIKVLSRAHENYRQHEVISVNIGRLWLDVKWNQLTQDYVYSRPVPLEMIKVEL